MNIEKYGKDKFNIYYCLFKITMYISLTFNVFRIRTSSRVGVVRIIQYLNFKFRHFRKIFGRL